MATLSAQKPVLTGTTHTLAAAAAAGDEFVNTGGQIFVVKNGHAADPRTITFDAPQADNFGIVDAAHDAAVVVPALTTKLIGPFPTHRFNDSNGKVQVTYSDSGADLTVAVLQQNVGA